MVNIPFTILQMFSTVWWILSIIHFLEAFLSTWRILRWGGDSGPVRMLEREPRVAVLAPCKGVDENLRENIESWLDQDYSNFQVFFIVESEGDPAVLILKSFPRGRLIVAGQSSECGQKVHNLRYAIAQLSGEYEVLAFVDSDSRVRREWLRMLVTHLDENAVTGYRWFIAPFGDVVANLRAVWNAGVLTLLGSDVRCNFAWGGSMAITRKAFEETDVLRFWQGSISDDYGLTNAMRGAGRGVRFVPGAMAFTSDRITFFEFFSWITRQLLITRIYNPVFWWQAFIYHTAWITWMVLGILLFPIPWAVLYLISHLLQVVKAEKRLRFAARVFPEKKPGYRLYFWSCIPLIGVLNFLALCFNLVSRRVRWRGVEYILKGPNELSTIRNFNGNEESVRMSQILTKITALREKVSAALSDVPDTLIGTIVFLTVLTLLGLGILVAMGYMITH